MPLNAIDIYIENLEEPACGLGHQLCPMGCKQKKVVLLSFYAADQNQDCLFFMVYRRPTPGTEEFARDFLLLISLDGLYKCYHGSLVSRVNLELGRLQDKLRDHYNDQVAAST